ncbi:MAG: mechanosensitive ion channel domain-containing protein [Halobacteriales archaeon]
MSWIQRTIESIREGFAFIDDPVVRAALVLAVGIVVGYLLGRITVRVLQVLGVDAVVEGTGTERWLQRMGTSTVHVIGRLVAAFTYVAAVLSAFLQIGAIQGDVFWSLATAWLPHLFVAILVVVLGIIVADKVEILVSERLQGIKLPEVLVIPAVVKYTIIFVAALIALGQVGVHTLALIVLLTVYAIGVVLLGTVALRDLLASGAAGVYLFLHEPYTIGDRVTIGDATGVVQEIDMFATRVEDDDVEYVVPNHRVVREGVVRERAANG